ncbi:hypothetical protein ACWC2T_43785 [Streptomyces sp. NPDC001393]
MAAGALREEAERWHEFLQARFEEVERRPKSVLALVLDAAPRAAN